MAETLTLARPYAEAVFKLARDTGALPQWSDALARLAAVVRSGPARELIGNPRITDAQAASIISEVAGGLSDEQRNFVRVLAGNERLSVLPEIVDAYESLRNGFEGVLEAEITSANGFIPIARPLRWSMVRSGTPGFAANPWGWHPLPPMAWLPR